MTCREVMDDMQRELDGDLSGSEAESLAEHIRNCSDCADMYDRLKRLSNELENLPKVTPPINLVDAILPQLELIDSRTHAESNEPAAAWTYGREETGQPSGREAKAGRRRRWVNRFSLRALSGVVAAGIVVGLFIITYEPPTAGDRDDAGQPFAAMNTASDQAESTSMSNASGSAEIEAADQNGALHVPVEASDQYGDPVDGRREAADSPASGAPNAGAANEPAADSAPRSHPLQDGAGSTSNEPLPEVAVTDNPDAGLRSKDALPVDDGESVSFLAVQEAEPLTETVSPDGAYAAVLSESRIVIYDAERVQLFESEPIDGVVTFIEWTPEGHALHYEATLEDGTIKRFRIEPKLGTHTEY